MNAEGPSVPAPCSPPLAAGPNEPKRPPSLTEEEAARAAWEGGSDDRMAVLLELGVAEAVASGGLWAPSLDQALDRLLERGPPEIAASRDFWAPSLDKALGQLQAGACGREWDPRANECGVRRRSMCCCCSFR